MRQGSLISAVALGGLFAAPAVMAQYTAHEAAAVQTLRCESGDGRERHCAIDTRGGVRMSRQLSRSACVQGQSWGVDRTGVWVGQGCRADFQVGRGGNDADGHSRREPRGNGGHVVRCESGSGRSNLCVMDTRRGVELVRQLSRSACMREQNWGWNDRGVWVSGGCRAEFRARGGDGYDDRVAEHAGQAIRCESKDGQTHHCPVETGGGVRLVRQLSRTACIEDRNWGYDRAGIWVQGGCRADFEAGDPGRHHR